MSWADLWKQLTFAEIDWLAFFQSWSWAKSMFVASLGFWLFEGAVMGGFIGHAFNLRQDGPFTLPMPFLFWELDNLVYQPTDQISQRYGVDLAFVYRVGAHVGLFGASVDVVRILTEWVLRRLGR